MASVCPRHEQEADIIRSEAGMDRDAKVFRTVHVLSCGEDVTLPSGLQLFDHCRFTAQQMRDAAVERRERVAKADEADEVSEARARKGTK